MLVYESSCRSWISEKTRDENRPDKQGVGVWERDEGENKEWSIQLSKH